MSHTKSASGSGLTSLKRYEEYYLTGGDLYFMVEHHIFRVHRYFFERESSYFQSKLTIPPGPGSVRPGSNESNAIILEDVFVHDFARFLWVFYNPKYSLYFASVNDWSTILSLAYRWAFPEVKALAIRELEKLDMLDIDRVVVYHTNDVDRNLLISRYAALCEREEPLTLPEGQRLGLETTLMLARAREFARAPLSTPRSPTISNVHGSELFAMVRELFGIPEPEISEEDVPEPSGSSPIVTRPLANGHVTINGTTNGGTTTNGDAQTTNGDTQTKVNASTPGPSTTTSGAGTTSNFNTTTGGKKGDPPATTTKANGEANANTTGANTIPFTTGGTDTGTTRNTGTGTGTASGQGQAATATANGSGRPQSPSVSRPGNTGNGNTGNGKTEEEVQEGEKGAAGGNPDWFSSAKQRRGGGAGGNRNSNSNSKK